MEEFLDELEILLDWYQSNSDIDCFEQEFKNLVHEYRTNDEVLKIADIVAHNYNCHKYNRSDAIINSIDQWEKYTCSNTL